MADIKETRTGRFTFSSNRLSLANEKNKIRTMQIIFALFSLILILLTVLSLAISP